MKKKMEETRKKGDEKTVAQGFNEETIDFIYRLAETVCESEGLELVHVEYQRESAGRILRIYIDKPGGVGLNDCTRISRELGDLLDIYLENIPTYNLEVSSPGFERPIGRASDFNKFKGRTVKIKIRCPIDGQKRFTGELLGIAEGIVKIKLKEKTVAVPHKEISKARLVNNYGESEC